MEPWRAQFPPILTYRSEMSLLPQRRLQPVSMACSMEARGFFNTTMLDWPTDPPRPHRRVGSQNREANSNVGWSLDDPLFRSSRITTESADPLVCDWSE